MSFTQQLIQLLTEAPGSIVYHMVTLLSIQAALGLALWQWRHNTAQKLTDPLPKRMVWAMSGILFARLVVIFAIFFISDQQTAVRILPPLEQAIDAVSIAIIVWVFSPRLRGAPRLGDVVLLIILLFTGFMYAFFAQAWIDQVDTGLISASYTTSGQANVWNIFQLSILGTGLFLVLIGRQKQWLLHFLLLSILLIAHLAQFLMSNIIVPTDSDIAFWVRLGNLFAFPLLVVVVYRNNLAQLLAGQAINQAPSLQSAHQLKLLQNVIGSLDINHTMSQAVEMTAELIKADYTAIAVVALNNPNQLHLVGTDKPKGSNEGKTNHQSWALNLADWPAIRLAMQQRQRVELIPNGLGARQLHDIYQELGITNLGSLLIEPLLASESEFGILLLAGSAEGDRWSTEDKSLSMIVASYVAQAIHNAQHYQKALQETKGGYNEDDTVVSGRLIALEKERDNALAEIESLTARWQHSESQLAAERNRSEALKTALETADNFNRDEKVTALEREIGSLRESLIEAEEAMALASAGEGGLSPEWVTMAITRYSGEVEEAVARIQQLESRLAQQEDSETQSQIADLIQQLRTPLTSLNGYSDLLIGESMGILGTNQMSLMRRVKANIAQMATLLDQMLQLSRRNVSPISNKAQVNINEAIEIAINSIRSEVRKKGLRLDLDLADDLPPISSEGDSFYQIVAHLLNNACQVSKNDGRILISAHHDSIQEKSLEGDVELFDFLHFAVTDSGNGLSQEIHSLVLEAHRQSDKMKADPSQNTVISNAGHSLSTAVHLVNAQGGRVWLSNEWETGDTLSVLLPLSNNEYAHQNGKSYS